jgi:hypothetical protein
MTFRASPSLGQVRQFSNIRRDLPRLVFGEQLGRRIAGLGEDDGVLLDRSSRPATDQPLCAIAIFAVDRSDHRTFALTVWLLLLGNKK